MEPLDAVVDVAVGAGLLTVSPDLDLVVVGRQRDLATEGRGRLLAATLESPERPFVATRNPLSVRDLHATIFHAMGVSHETAYEVEKRPFYATEDGKGKPALGIFA